MLSRDGGAEAGDVMGGRHKIRRFYLKEEEQELAAALPNGDGERTTWK